MYATKIIHDVFLNIHKVTKSLFFIKSVNSFEFRRINELLKFIDT